MWAASDTYNVGGRRVRVRAGSLEAATAVRRTLVPHPAVDDRHAPYDLSVRLEPPALGRNEHFHLLYAGGCLAARSRDPMRILRVLRAHAEAGLAEEDERHLHIRGIALAGTRGAALLPVDLRVEILALERRLAAAGLRVIDAPHATFDLHSGELLVLERPDVPGDVVRDLTLNVGDDDGPAPPGRHQLRGWMVDGLRGIDDRTRHATRQVLNTGAIGWDRAEHVVDRLRLRAQVIDRWYPWPDDLASALIRIAEGRY